MTTALYGPPKEMRRYLIDISDSTTIGPATMLAHYKLAGIYLPGTLTSTAINFLVAEAIDGTYVQLNDVGGTEVAVTVAASRGVGITGAQAAALAPWMFVKVVMGSAEAADRILWLSLAH